MKERGILFSAPMVRAVLDGTKMQTRRVAKLGEDEPVDWPCEPAERCSKCGTTSGRVCQEPSPGEVHVHAPNGFNWRNVASPYGVPGDGLWVRESFRLRRDQDDKKPSEDWWKSGAWYAADGPEALPSGCGGGAGKLRPSIHMPRWASRIDLDVTGVRIERLQNISESEAEREGVELPRKWLPGKDPTYRHHFAALWDRINASRGFPWSANPWIWVVEFKHREGAP